MTTHVAVTRPAHTHCDLLAFAAYMPPHPPRPAPHNPLLRPEPGTHARRVSDAPDKLVRTTSSRGHGSDTSPDVQCDCPHRARRELIKRHLRVSVARVRQRLFWEPQAAPVFAPAVLGEEVALVHEFDAERRPETFGGGPREHGVRGRIGGEVEGAHKFRRVACVREEGDTDSSARGRDGWMGRGRTGEHERRLELILRELNGAYSGGKQRDSPFLRH